MEVHKSAHTDLDQGSYHRYRRNTQVKYLIIHFICIALFRKFKDTLWGIKIIKSVHIKLQMNPNAGVHKITRTQTNLKEIEDGAVYVMKGQATQDNSSNV